MPTCLFRVEPQSNRLSPDRQTPRGPLLGGRAESSSSLLAQSRKAVNALFPDSLAATPSSSVLIPGSSRHSRHIQSHDGPHNLQTPAWDKSAAWSSWVGNIHSAAPVRSGRIVVPTIGRVVVIVVKGCNGNCDSDGGERISFVGRRRLVAAHVGPGAQGINVRAGVSVQVIDLAGPLLTRSFVISESGEIIGKTVYTRGAHDEVVIRGWRQQSSRHRRGRLLGIESRRIERRVSQKMNRAAPLEQARRRWL